MKKLNLHRLFGSIFLMMILLVAPAQYSRSQITAKNGAGPKGNALFRTDYIDSLISAMELIPIRVTGDKNNRINIVILNRWEGRDIRPYNSPEQRAEFLNDINGSLLAAFKPGNPKAATAYANYYPFFNLYALWWPGAPELNSGVMNTDLVDAVRDRIFLPWKEEFTGWATVLIMPNRESGGGGAARDLEARTGNAVIAGNQIGKMLHEISHTCTSIGDEYTAAAEGTAAVYSTIRKRCAPFVNSGWPCAYTHS